MLIIALVLAVIGLALLVFAVVTSNSLVAWFCIGASVLGVVLLIVDAVQERRRRAPGDTADNTAAADSKPHPGTDQAADSAGSEPPYEDYPEESDDRDAHEVSSRRAESGAGASEEPGGSDEYDHGALGEDTSR